MYKLEYLPLALRDITEIVRYISKDLSNPTAAENLANTFIESAENLKEFPYANSVYTPIRSLNREYRRVFVCNYTMFYFVNEDTKTITISRIVYSKRDYENLKL